MTPDTEWQTPASVSGPAKAIIVVGGVGYGIALGISGDFQRWFISTAGLVITAIIVGGTWAIDTLANYVRERLRN
jgi:hypothetical protein